MIDQALHFGQSNFWIYSHGEMNEVKNLSNLIFRECRVGVNFYAEWVGKLLNSHLGYVVDPSVCHWAYVDLEEGT